ncbi:SNF2-related protein [Massilimicrobiota sp. SW1139]|uniref:SNF2-related protein n=1 Tax=Bacillota TaxID=1239 RepID=UPI0014387D4A|nr:SNF2-related protein [Massilimicrobiota sp. SW1139]NJE44290.1 helicase [Massilimicrobiota sp. SW1139]
MLNDYNFLPVYNSYEDDILNEFYIPVFSNSILVERVSAYFTGKALSQYAQGLEVFENKNGKYRLIISNEISSEDFESIKKGYEINKKFIDSMIESFDDFLTIKDIQNLSNLSYLIAKGIVEIKIAYTKKGIFHDKCAIFCDELGNEICMRGSNNESQAAIQDNYESFDLTCSWLSSNFDKEKIYKTKKYFSALWNNMMTGVYVMNIPDKLYDKILSYNKGKIIVDEVYLMDNCLILDYVDGKMMGYNKLEDKGAFVNSPKFKLNIRRYVESIDLKKNITFKGEYGYLEYQKIIGKIINVCDKLQLKCSVTSRLQKYIDEHNLYIDKRRNLGVAIKNKDSYLLDRYEKYKSIVNGLMDRQLREQQMWDSFFMAMMRKSSNFSVPGSGKTSSVYGAYAYMNKYEEVDKIVMIGPLNSFVSWIDEFLACFGEKKKLRCLNIHDRRFNTLEKKKAALVFPEKKYNLILVNYESVGSLKYELKEIINNHVLLVFDEVHRIKSPVGQIAQNCLNVASKATRVITMTGTPIPNSYCDIYNNLHLLFNDEYNTFFHYSVQELKNISEEKMEEVNRAMYPFFCRTTKRQLMVPPANPDIILKNDASDLENRMLYILRATYRKNPLALIIRILQMESNPHLLLKKIDTEDLSKVLDINVQDINDIDFVDFNGELKNIVDEVDKTTKFNETISQIKKLVSSGKNLCLWCIFKDTMNQFSDFLNELEIKNCVINGAIPVEERDYLISQFKEGKIDVLITNPHTLAESISLHKCCHDAIYFEYSYNLVHLLQSKDRIHRLGLPKGQYTQYYYMEINYCIDENDYSLDDKIYNRLLYKEQRMLDAVDRNVLEKVSTEEEDIDFILNGLL